MAALLSIPLSLLQKAKNAKPFLLLLWEVGTSTTLGFCLFDEICSSVKNSSLLLLLAVMFRTKLSLMSPPIIVTVDKTQR